MNQAVNVRNYVSSLIEEGARWRAALKVRRRACVLRDCADFLVIRHNKVSMLFTVHALITQVSDSVKL